MGMMPWRRSTRERRRSARRPVQWIGHYGNPNSVESTWSPCAIENISASGAGTVVYGGHPVAAGERIALDVERIGATTVGLRVHGVVRHAGAPEPDGMVTFGVELEFTTPQDLRTAQTLFEP